MTLSPDRIGDRGQRYEVRYRDETCAGGPHKIVGWTNSEPDAEQMAAAWRSRPSTTNAWVADRQWASPDKSSAPAEPIGAECPENEPCDEA